jgi:hypothetical protein
MSPPVITFYNKKNKKDLIIKIILSFDSMLFLIQCFFKDILGE